MELEETAAADCASFPPPPPPSPPPPPPPPPLPPPLPASMAVGLKDHGTPSMAAVEPDDLCCSPLESLHRDVTSEEMETTRRTRNKICSVDSIRKTTNITDNTRQRQQQRQQQQRQQQKTAKIDSNSSTNSDKICSTAIVAHQSSSTTVICGCSSSNPGTNRQHQQQQQQQQPGTVSSQHPPPPRHHRNDCGSDSREDLLLGNNLLLPFSADDNREFDFLLKAPLLPRSSSLKSRKTPPPADTPYTHRKSVRFADALGLDLELVRHILNPDEPPNVPLTAMRSLESVDHHPLKVISYWRICFPHPSTTRNLLDRVLQEKVSLESCSIVNSNRKVYGTVRVSNIGYEKKVRVRYSLNGWLTCEEVEATYIEHSNDLITDRFSFELLLPDHLVVRSRMEFAIKFTAANQTFWDNNSKRNYALQCVDYNDDDDL